jgi:hypothetical protein
VVLLRTHHQAWVSRIVEATPGRGSQIRLESTSAILTAYHRPPPLPSRTIPLRVTTTRVPYVHLMGQADAAEPRSGSSGNEKGPRVLEICVSDAVGFIAPLSLAISGAQQAVPACCCSGMGSTKQS